MLLTTPESRRWRRRALVILVLLAAIYAWMSHGGYAHGGSVPGLILGFATLALIFVLLWFGVRKRSYRSRLGTLEGWLQAHLYLGFLSLAVAFFHSGFRFQDRLATAALVVLAAVVVTGFLGALLYTTVPRLLSEVESNLTVGELSERLNQITASMTRLAEGKSATFRRVQAGLVEESRPRSLAGWRTVFSPQRRRRAAVPTVDDAAWKNLLGRVAEEEREDLRRLLVLSRQHKELHQRLTYQQRYRNLLDAWLWLHLPLSLVLLVLALGHGIAALYYRGWGAG